MLSSWQYYVCSALLGLLLSFCSAALFPLIGPSPEYTATVEVGYTVASNEAWHVRRYTAIGSTVIESTRKRYIGSESPPRRNDLSSTPASDLVPAWCALQSASPAFAAGNADIEFEVINYCGWPIRCLWLRYVTSLSRMPVQVRHGWKVGEAPVTHGGNWMYPPAIPMRPIWPGLFVNASFYTAIILLANVFVRRIRAHVRLQSGKCPVCSYLLNDPMNGCSECGWCRA